MRGVRLRQPLLPADLPVHREDRLREPAEVVHGLGANRQASFDGRGIGGQRERGGARPSARSPAVARWRACRCRDPGTPPSAVGPCGRAAAAGGNGAAHRFPCPAASSSPRPADGRRPPCRRLASPHARWGKLRSSTVRKSAWEGAAAESVGGETLHQCGRRSVRVMRRARRGDRRMPPSSETPSSRCTRSPRGPRGTGSPARQRQTARPPPTPSAARHRPT